MLRSFGKKLQLAIGLLQLLWFWLWVVWLAASDWFCSEKCRESTQSSGERCLTISTAKEVRDSKALEPKCHTCIPPSAFIGWGGKSWGPTTPWRSRLRHLSLRSTCTPWTCQLAFPSCLNYNPPQQCLNERAERQTASDFVIYMFINPWAGGGNIKSPKLA